MFVRDYVKHLLSWLPDGLQQELKRLRYGRQIRRGDFGGGEPENAILSRYVRPGDWVLDVGANIGQYTWQLSSLVGPEGRVLAIEPIPATFALLAANAQKFVHRNVSLFNVALSDRASSAPMFIPRLETGMRNYYQASLEHNADAEPNCSVLTLAFDQFGITHRFALIKIDAEGHDERVLAGMLHTVERDRPVLIVEAPTAWTLEQLVRLGYESLTLPGSPNTIFTIANSDARPLAA